MISFDKRSSSVNRALYGDLEKAVVNLNDSTHLEPIFRSFLVPLYRLHQLSLLQIFLIAVIMNYMPQRRI